MKVLLLGEYSNVHNTLAQGLRQLGHQVTVASNGDFWKDYPRDVDLARRPGKMDGLSLLARVCGQLPRWRGYDVVQLINPMFLELKAERILPVYRYLRRHNRHVVLGAFGLDWYWVHECVTRMPLLYSDFNLGHELRTDAEALRYRDDWLDTHKGRLNQLIANDADAIVSGLYEYHVCYQPYFPQKTHYIPLPINTAPAEDPTRRLPGQEPSEVSPLSPTRRLPGQEPSEVSHLSTPAPQPIRVFIGISKGRSAYKGTDIMLPAAEAVQARYPERMELVKAEGLPFSEYQRLMDGSDVLLDQLYGYSPAMNALLAMSKGIVCVGGGEEEHYALLGEHELRPIVNVRPTYDSVCHALEQLVLNPEQLPELKRQSRLYVSRHYDYLKVARRYEALYRSL